MGSVPDHSKKVNIAIKRVTRIFFGFSVHIKIMFMAYYIVCYVCNNIMSIKTMYIP